MIRDRRPPSQTWHSFLENHARDIIAVDFLTVPTATFRVLFVLVVLSHDRRKILHTNATEHPTAIWTARQILEAIGTDDVPAYLLHDRDAIFGAVFKRQTASAGLREVITAPKSPWQNPYAERVIGSIRRVVGDYVRYYNKARTHLSLEKDAPAMRAIHPPNLGPIVSKDQCGGLHHEYLRVAA